MRRKSNQTRRKIVEAAYYLFYRKGFVRVNVDEVAARAGITKRTLYSYFRSKDDLLAAALLHYSALDMERLDLIGARMPPQPGAKIDSFFAQLVEWAGTPRWIGSGFTRLAVELADLPGHPARTIGRRAKASTERWLTGLLQGEKVRQPQARAREVMLLMEGAMVLMLIHGD
ncbi:MAG: TetR/AcrR family transcriptional regulator, partial [Candidatus Binatia bacterium]